MLLILNSIKVTEWNGESFGWTWGDVAVGYHYKICSDVFEMLNEKDVFNFALIHDDKFCDTVGYYDEIYVNGELYGLKHTLDETVMVEME